MAILDDMLVKQFVRATNDKAPPKKEDNLYGTAKVDEDGNFAGVIFDGSTIVTPCTTVVDVTDGDRVIVTVKNREAVITGNVSRPSISTSTIETNELTAKDKIMVYAPVWDPNSESYTGEFHTVEVVSMAETNPYYTEIQALQKADLVLIATPFVDENEVMHYPEVQMYDVGVHTLKVADRAGTQKSIGLYSGNTEAFTVNANGYTDHVIEFPEGAFTQSPIVTVTPTSGSQAAAMGEISWAITAVTADDVTVRIFNNSASRYITLNWIAMGE